MNPRSAKEIWETALGELQLQVSKPNYSTWLKGSVGLSHSEGQFVIGVPTPFAAEWLEKRLRSLVKKTLVGILGEDVEIEFHVSSPHAEDAPSHKQTSGPSYTHRSKTHPHPKVNPKYTFENFIHGRCNQLAYAAAQGVAENPGHTYNPLVIQSGVGLGKTHLLHAIGHAAASHGFNVLCVSMEEFTNDFVEAVRGRETGKFRAKFRSPDLLLLDDLHFISGKEQTQQGFFHTFNDLYNANRQIVVTCDRPPKAIPMLDDRISSRLQGGLIVDLQPPDRDTCLSILRAKAAIVHHHALPDDVLEIIADHGYNSNMRDLEGALNRVIAFAKTTRQPPTAQLALEALCAPTDLPIPRPTPSLIVEIVSEYFRLSPQELVGRRRAPQLSEARQLTMYIIYKQAHCSLKEIGQLLGGRDHSTILEACRKVSTQIDANPQLRTHLDGITALLSEKCSSTAGF